MSGFDAVLLHGALPDWSYIYIHDGFAEIREAKHLLGKDTFEVDQIIKGELGKKDRQMSVLCIGPAAEKLVKFAVISVDKGHMASHNGVGAVMGSKKLKAIAVDRGTSVVPLHDKDSIPLIAKELLDRG